MDLPDNTKTTSDESSFEDWCRVQFPKLVGSLALFCGDASEAEDFAQEALARAYVKWPAVQRMDNPEGWLFAVGANAARSWFRRLRRRRQIEAGLVAPSMGEEGTYERAETLEMLKVLTDRQRSVVILRHYLRFSTSEMAQCLDIPEGTVKSLHRRALERLRKENHDGRS